MAVYSEFGKIEYIIAHLPNVKWIQCYSADKLQNDLLQKFQGQKLIAVYANLNGYLQALTRPANIVDLTYMGGSTLVEFERDVLQLFFEGIGTMEYRSFPVWEMKRHSVFDYPLDDMLFNKSLFIDIADQIKSIAFKDMILNDVKVTKTDVASFCPSRFEEEKLNKAGSRNDLPAMLTFCTEESKIHFVGSAIEYYQIRVEKAESKQRR